LQFVGSVFVASAMLRHDRNSNARESLASIFDCHEVAERIHTFNPHRFAVRQDHAALAARIIRRNTHELEVDGIFVVNDEQAVLGANHDMFDVIFDALFAGPDDLEFAGRCARVEQPNLARHT